MKTIITILLLVFINIVQAQTIYTILVKDTVEVAQISCQGDTLKPQIFEGEFSVTIKKKDNPINIVVTKEYPDTRTQLFLSELPHKREQLIFIDKQGQIIYLE